MQETLTAPPESGLRSLARRHPISLFLVLALGGAYALSVVPILMEYGVLPGRALVARVGLGMERAASLLLILALFPAALLVTVLEGGWPAARVLLRRMLRWRVPWAMWVVAVVALPLLTVVIAVLLGDAATRPSGQTLWRELISIVIALLLANLWEEAVWAGFLQTRLERRHNFFMAAALTAIPFAAVHLPLRVINGAISSAGDFVVNFAMLLVLGLILRPLMGLVLRGAANSLLLVALTHTFFNRSNNTDGIAADILVGDSRPIAALLATVGLIILLALILRGRLNRSYRHELDRTEQLS